MNETAAGPGRQVRQVRQVSRKEAAGQSRRRAASAHHRAEAQFTKSHWDR